MQTGTKKSLGLVVGGVAVAVVALQIIDAFGGAPEIQVAESPTEFGQLAAEFGNPVRWSNAVDMFLFVPAFLVALLGAIRGLSASRGPQIRRLGTFGVVTSTVWALADTIENIITFVGLGTADLDGAEAASDVDPASGLIDALNTFTSVKVLFLFISLALIVVLAVLALVHWIRTRSTSASDAR